MNDEQNGRRSLAALLRGYAPRPGQAFYSRMAKAPWSRESSRGTLLWTGARTRFAVAFAVLVLILGAMALATPEVRASLSAWLGLGVSPTDVVTPPAVQPSELVSGATLQSLSKQAGWTIVAPTRLPAGYRFGQANYDTRNGLVYMSFLVSRPLPGATSGLTQTKALSLVQSPQNTLIPLQVAPTTSVQDVTINGQPGAYAVGAWKSEFVPKAGEAGGGHFEARWRSDLQVQNVFWQVGTVYVVLISDDTLLSRAELLQIASGVK